MGCASSRSSPTSPAIRSIPALNDEWMFYEGGRVNPLFCQHCCGRPPRTGDPTASSGTYTSRSYSLLPTPRSSVFDGHSRSSSRHRQPTASVGTDTSRSHSLLPTPRSSVCDAHSRFSSPHLRLDASIFEHNTFRTTCTKIDTDCASRFSNEQLYSLSPSSSDYPLSPLSIRTEPFPR